MRPHISLDVRDVAQSVAFYEKVFGVKPRSRWPTMPSLTSRLPR